MAAAKRDSRKRSRSRSGVACAGKGARSGRGSGARKQRLAQIRREIEDGTYETEGKLRIAISRLIDDVLERRKERS